MPDRIFIDTNVLVYAHDKEAGPKHHVAAEIVKKLWEDRNGVLSLQVLQEFYVVLTQKVKEKLSKKVAKDLLKQYGYWELVTLSVDGLLEAIELQERHPLSFWDSLIVEAALLADCAILLSEDFQDGLKIKGLTVQNPF